MKIRIKICCISSVSEALTAIESGADAIGLVAEMPSGPGPIPEVRPFAVDVCSGVRTNGALDRGKVSAFVNNAMIV